MDRKKSRTDRGRFKNRSACTHPPPRHRRSFFLRHAFTGRQVSQADHGAHGRPPTPRNSTSSGHGNDVASVGRWIASAPGNGFSGAHKSSCGSRSFFVLTRRLQLSFIYRTSLPLSSWTPHPLRCRCRCVRLGTKRQSKVGNKRKFAVMENNKIHRGGKIIQYPSSIGANPESIWRVRTIPIKKSFRNHLGGICIYLGVPNSWKASPIRNFL